MLREVPPWWSPELARAAGARATTNLTARNWGRAVRRRLGERDPDRTWVVNLHASVPARDLAISTRPWRWPSICGGKEAVPPSVVGG